MRRLTILANLLLVLRIVYAACPASQTKPSPFPPAGALTLGISSGTTVTTGNMPGSAGVYQLPSSNHTINSGNVNVNVDIYVQTGQTLTINYAYNVNASIFNIFVDAGGTLNFNTGQFKGSKLYIWGNLIVGQDTEVQASTGFYLGPQGVFLARAAGSPPTLKRVTLPSSAGQFLIDGGSVEASDIYINNLTGSTGDVLCLTNSGCIKTGGFSNNDEASAISSSDGTGHIWMTGTTFNNINNQLLNSTAPPNVCTALASVDATKWCGGVATCISKVTANCSSTSAPSAKCNNALPVYLLYFQAKLDMEGVKLVWSTSFAIGSNYFVVEKSSNGKNWELVGSIPALNGNSREDYFLIDAEQSSGVVYYRLSEVDLYGSKKAYAITSKENGDQEIIFEILPNPSDGKVNFHVSAGFVQYDMEVIDLQGRQTGKYRLISGDNLLSLNLSSGIYIAKLKVGPEYKMQKMVIR